MSTAYRVAGRKPIQKKNLLASIEAKQIDLQIGKMDEDGSFCISDGTNYLWCYPYGKQNRLDFERWAGNHVENILGILEQFFDVEILSEHDEGYF